MAKKKNQTRSAKYAYIAEDLKREALEQSQNTADDNETKPENQLDNIISAITFDIEQFSNEIKEISIIENADSQIESKPENTPDQTENTEPEVESSVETEEKPEETIENEAQESEETYEKKDIKQETATVEPIPSDYQKNEKTIPDNRNNDLKQIITIFSILLFVLLIFTGIGIFKNRSLKDESSEVIEEIVEEVPAEKNTMDSSLRDLWLSNKAINSDYIGQIIFDSGLIDLPFVQAKSVYDRNGDLYTFYTENGNLVEDPEGYTGNDVYIWTNWKTGKYDNGNDEGGSVFMDFRNNLNDQNIIIYGHHFARDWDPSGTKQFTPLDLLLDEDNYENNKALKLILDNEIREYVITNVFTIDIDNEYELNIMRRNMDEDYSGNADPGFFKDFIEYINNENRYQIDETLSDSDRILTLVTCIQHQPQYRQIIVCKEVNAEKYE